MNAGDFDGDGTDDLLWRNINGSVAIWFMSGGTIAGTAFYGVPQSWEIVAP